MNKRTVTYSIEELRSSFAKTLEYVWAGYHVKKFPALSQIDMANYLQSSPDRTIIQASRMYGKTDLACLYTLWYLWNNPDNTVLLVSAAEDLVIKSSKLLRDWLDYLPIFKEMQPKKKTLDSARAFDIATRTKPDKTPSITVKGITGSITGLRADLIIGDDLENPSNTNTAIQKEKILGKIEEFTKIIKVGGKIVLIGTPHSYASIYNDLLGVYQMRCYPMRIPDPSKKVYQYLAPELKEKVENGELKIGAVSDPSRFTEDFAVRKEAECLSRKAWSLQYLLDTELGDEEKYPLKLRNLMIYDCNLVSCPKSVQWTNENLFRINKVEHGIHASHSGADNLYEAKVNDKDVVPYMDSVLAVDPSGEGNDETAWCCAKYGNGLIYILEVDGTIRGCDDAQIRELIKKAVAMGINTILVEEGVGNDVYSRLFQAQVFNLKGEIKFCPMIKTVKPRGMKERRMLECLEPVFMNHKIVVDRSVFQKDSLGKLAYQITKLEEARGCLEHDDRVEAFSMAVSYFRDKLNMNQGNSAFFNTEREGSISDMDYLLKQIGKKKVEKPNILKNGNFKYGIRKERKRIWQ